MLTGALFLLGEAERARALGEDTLHRCRRMLGPDHVTTLTTASTLVLALIALGDAERAHALSDDTMPRCRRVLGPAHPLTQYLTQGASSGHLVPLLTKGSPKDNPGRPQ
jgi:hypothetical protein